MQMMAVRPRPGADVAHRIAPAELSHRFGDVIEPTWWNGTPAIDPDRFTIDCGGRLGARPSRALAAEISETFDEVGLVHLRNTGLVDVEAMRQHARVVIDDQMRYDGGSNPRDNLAKNVYEVGAPLSAWLHYHHEMAYIGTSTRRLAFLCHTALPGRGSTFVSDSVAATAYLLETRFGQKLRDLGICYHRNMTDRDAYVDKLEVGVYNHWQKSLGTEDPDVAEAKANERGLVTAWGPNRLLKTKYTVSAFEYFAELDRNLLYSSVADHGMWFDAWPLVMHLPYEDRPLHMTFGDGSEISRDELAEFVALYGRFGIEIDWRQGDVAMVCNHRFAHGRPAISLGPGEDRVLGVMLGASFDRVGAVKDKWGKVA